MRIHIEVDCTPEEARKFFGLPDVAPMQQKLLEGIESRLQETLSATEGKALMEQWLPLSIRGMEQWQQFWTQLAAAAAGAATARGQKASEGSKAPRKGSSAKD